VGGKETDMVRRKGLPSQRVYHDANDMPPAPPLQRPAANGPSAVQQAWASAQEQLQAFATIAKDNPEDTAIVCCIAGVLLLILCLSIWVLPR